MEGESSNSRSTVSSTPAQKKTKGRQKIEMKRIKTKDRLNVTFSKRQNGLFKKAGSLCELCNTEMAILVLSPSGKLHSWGYPSLKSVVDRFPGRDVDERVQEVQEELREKPNPGADGIQDSSMAGLQADDQVVYDRIQILDVEGTGPRGACTRDFLDRCV